MWEGVWGHMCPCETVCARIDHGSSGVCVCGQSRSILSSPNPPPASAPTKADDGVHRAERGQQLVREDEPEREGDEHARHVQHAGAPDVLLYFFLVGGEGGGMGRVRIRARRQGAG